MNNDHNNNGNSNNWLGFSLSPHMKMEVTSSDPSTNHHHQYHHQGQASSAAVSNAVPPSPFYLSPSHLSSSGMSYGVGPNGGFHSPFSVMPLKSDGSLCIMEALTRSQTEGLLCFTYLIFFIFVFRNQFLLSTNFVYERNGAELVAETGRLSGWCKHGNP